MSQYDVNEKIWYYINGLPVTTLYLQSISDESRLDHVFEHFSAFGAVTTLSIHGTPTNWFGYVTFGDATSAARALVMKFHTIGCEQGQQTRVTIADTAYRAKQLANEVTDGNATQLMHLNDDCLHEVFSFFDVLDLCKVARTCTRFEAIANRVFTINHKICYLKEPTSGRNDHDARRVLVTFGSLISELKARGSRYNNKEIIGLLDLVTRCCYDNLKSLTLFSINTVINISEWLTIKLRPLLSKLKKLHIICCTIQSNDNELLTYCESLVDLKVFYVTFMGGFEKKMFEKIFPKLERLHVTCYGSFIGLNLQYFISRHKNLKSLSLSKCTSSTLRTIADNCKLLDELQLTYESSVDYEEGFKSLSTLEQLRKLKINSNTEYLMTFVKHLKHLTSLECLELECLASGYDFIPALLQLNKLQVLQLKYCSNVPYNRLGELNQLTELVIEDFRLVDLDVVALIKRLSNLKTLDLDLSNFKMDKPTYFRIADVIRERPGVYKENFRIKCADGSYVRKVHFHGDNHKIVKLN